MPSGTKWQVCGGCRNITGVIDESFWPKCFRIAPGFVHKYSIEVCNKHSVLGNSMTQYYGIFDCSVRHIQRTAHKHSQRFQYNRVYVRHPWPVGKTRESFAADNAINFIVCPFLYLRIQYQIQKTKCESFRGGL